MIKAKGREAALSADDDEDRLEDDLGIGGQWSLEERQQVAARIEASGTPLGLPDVAFDAPSMVQDAYDACIQKSAGIDFMMDAILQAARRMDAENWERFQQIPLLHVHQDDAAVHSNLFAQTEPSWRPLLQRPKKRRQSCEFLHMGTAAMTSGLADFLTKLGWSGVCVGPVKPPPGNEDLLKHVNLDPAAEKDQMQIDALLSETGGLVPRPPTFPLAYVNVVFNVNEEANLLDPNDDDYEEQLEARQRKEEMEQQQQKEKRTSKEQSQQENAPLPAIPPATIAGYGVVGLTRGHRVRRRLQALKNSLAITLGRLAKDGTLVVLWPGLPLHPVLFFIAGSLRPLFQRVHVFSPEGSKTFEVYILAAGYKREKADSKVPGMGGLELRSFFEDTWRCDGLDDVLLWTLAPMAEDEETNVGITGKGLILGYTQLWKTWGTKLTSLALDLGMLLGQDDGMASPTSGKKSTRTKAARAKERAKNRDKKPPEAAPKLPKPKETDVTKKTAPKEQPAADEPDKVSEKPKAEAQEASEKPRADGAEEASEKPDEEAPEKPKDQEASGEPRDEASHSPKAPEAAKGAPEVTVKTAAAVSEQREEKQDEDTRQPDTKGERDRRPSDPDPKGSSRRSKPGGWARRQVPFGAKLHPVEDDAKPRRPRFVLKRAMPSLSCSLGASPGNKYLQPDYEELAEKHPLIHKALEVVRHGKQKHWDLDNEESAGGRGSMTDGLRFSTLEDPSTAHASQVSSLETISPVEPNS